MIGARLWDSNYQNAGSPGMLEGSNELRGKYEICVTRTLVLSRAGLTPVRIANFSEKPIRICSDRPVAEYRPISSVNGSLPQ